MEEAVVDAWWEARSRGERAAMMAPTNESVVALNHRAQAIRGQAGEIELAGPSVEAGSYRLHVGDAVATRRNDREMRTDRGLMVKNRDRWDARRSPRRCPEGRRSHRHRPPSRRLRH
jgi:hypothetical protein